MDRDHRDERDQESCMGSDVEAKGEKDYRRMQHPEMDHMADTDCEVNSCRVSSPLEKTIFNVLLNEIKKKYM